MTKPTGGMLCLWETIPQLRRRGRGSSRWQSKVGAECVPSQGGWKVPSPTCRGSMANGSAWQVGEPSEFISCLEPPEFLVNDTVRPGGPVHGRWSDRHRDRRALGGRPGGTGPRRHSTPDGLIGSLIPGAELWGFRHVWDLTPLLAGFTVQ